MSSRYYIEGIMHSIWKVLCNKQKNCVYIIGGNFRVCAGRLEESCIKIIHGCALDRLHQVWWMRLKYEIDNHSGELKKLDTCNKYADKHCCHTTLFNIFSIKIKQ